MASYTDPGVLEFEAVVVANPTGPGAFIEVPFDVFDLFGVKGRVPVHATFDGVVYQGSLAAHGGRHVVGVLKDIQRQLGKGPGDPVHVTLQLDAAERTVQLDPDLETALETAGLLTQFRTLGFTHQREYVQWVTEAKRAETRSGRIAKMLTLLTTGRTS